MTTKASRISSSASARRELKKMLDDLTRATGDGDRSFFTDWGDPREYTLGDMGVGECAGEVVSPFDFAAGARPSGNCSKRSWQFEAGQIEEAGKQGLPRHAARGQGAGEDAEYAYLRDDPDQIVRRVPHAILRHAIVLGSVRRRQIRALLLRRARQKRTNRSPWIAAATLLDEAQLFIDAAHSCNHKMMTAVTV